LKYLKSEIKEYDVEKIRCICGVRYWEDASVDGKRDLEGSLIPNRRGDCWDITIDIATGKIDNWSPEVTANIYYKVCDDGVYQLLDHDGMIVTKKDGYVPGFLSPNDNGHGDYIIMKIDKQGMIEGWRPTSSQIQEYFSNGEND